MLSTFIRKELIMKTMFLLLFYTFTGGEMHTIPKHLYTNQTKCLKAGVEGVRAVAEKNTKEGYSIWFECKEVIGELNIGSSAKQQFDKELKKTMRPPLNITPEDIQRLRDDPSLATEFDFIFGEGSAARYLKNE